MAISKRERRANRAQSKQDDYKVCAGRTPGTQHKVAINTKVCPMCGLEDRFFVLAWMPESLVKQFYEAAAKQDTQAAEPAEATPNAAPQ